MSDIFFVLSKLAVPLLDPGTWLLVLPALSLWFVWRARYRAASWTLACTMLFALAIFSLPTGALLVRPLEQAISAPAELPPRIDGIITLAGALDPTLTQEYGRPQLNGDAERVTEFVALARTYPEAKLVFAGDSGFLAPERINEAEVMRRFLLGQGFDPARVTFESKSRNTHESAAYTYALLQPKPGESWLLITSAFHMSRAYATFRKSGWDIIAYPVSYRLPPTFSFNERGYGLIRLAVHEWLGIAVYQLTNRM